MIRTARRADIETIVAFNTQLGAETEDVVLDDQRLRTGVQAMFDDPRRGRYVVAEINGRVVGQIMITFEWSDWRNGDFWWIQGVYVEPDFRAQGVFRALFDHVKKAAEADPAVCGLRLYVDAHNQPAKEIYRRLGLRPARYDMMELDFVRDSF